MIRTPCPVSSLPVSSLPVSSFSISFFPVYCALSLLLSISIHKPALAQSATQRHETHGEIQLEVEEKKRNPFSKTRIEAHFFIQEIAKEVHALAQGDAGALPPTPSDEALRYLAASYLYCSVQKGICPEILTAILEFDIIKSRFQKVAVCPSMLRFWDYWIKDDLEKRHQYLTKTGYFKLTTDFKKKERPRYIKCVPTVSDAIIGEQNHSAYFKKRYSTQPEVVRDIDNADLLMKEIEKKVPNVFNSVGMKF